MLFRTSQKATKTHSRIRSVLLNGSVLLGLVIMLCLLTRREWQQAKLDRQLIAALTKKDTKTAIALIEAGADPNTRSDPTSAFSSRQLVKQILNRSSAVNDSQTAFMMACGAVPNGPWPPPPPYITDTIQGPLRTAQNPKRAKTSAFNALLKKIAGEKIVEEADTQLIHTMLLHSAKVNARDVSGWTALHYAAMEKSEVIIKQLLDNGADPNLSSGSWGTASDVADAYDRPQLVALLRQYSKRP